MTDACIYTTDVQLDKDGYPRAKHGGRIWRLSRLIYTFVHGKLNDGDVVGHSCNNKGCINPNHLYLTTAKENSTHAARDGLYRTGENHPKAKLNKALADEIRLAWYTGDWSQNSLATMYGVSQSVISEIVRGVKWK